MNRGYPSRRAPASDRSAPDWLPRAPEPSFQRMKAPTAIALVVLALGPKASANCQLGGSSCGDPFAIDCNNGVVCFVPWRSCSGCTCTVTGSGKTCFPTAAEPGAVATIHVDKSVAAPGSLD